LYTSFVLDYYVEQRALIDPITRIAGSARNTSESHMGVFDKIAVYE